VVAVFADLRNLNVKDAERLPSLQHAVTTYLTLPEHCVDLIMAIDAPLLATPNRTSVGVLQTLNRHLVRGVAGTCHA